jgi:hypothetical protein
VLNCSVVRVEVEALLLLWRVVRRRGLVEV